MFEQARRAKSRRLPLTGPADQTGTPAPGSRPGDTRAGPVRHCRIEGARTHNLKAISCSIPFGRFTLVTGVSGSGKSSLVFDTLHAEGHRRFLDCLSTYARQFLQRPERPDADRIGEIQPPVALTQRNMIRNARSTVGMLTELGDRLQMLLLQLGTMHCHRCGAPMKSMRFDDGVEAMLSADPALKWILAAPIPPGPVRTSDGLPLVSESAEGRLEALARSGYTRIYRDGRMIEWENAGEQAVEAIRPVSTGRPGDQGGSQERGWSGTRPAGEILLVIDRFVSGSLVRSRARESLEAAWRLGEGTAVLFALGQAEPARILTEGLQCEACGARAELPHPKVLSADSPLGACRRCQGFGRVITVDRAKVVPDPSRSLRGLAVVPLSTERGQDAFRLMLRLARARGIPLDAPFSSLDEEQREWIFRGDVSPTGSRTAFWPGVEGFFRDLERKRYKAHVRIFLARFRAYVPCPDCRGSRRAPEALRLLWRGHTIDDLERLSIGEIADMVDCVELTAVEEDRSGSLVRETAARLRSLTDIGLGYLSPSRSARTLSGGEVQRVRLGAAIGSALTETLYIFDEPTTGLHAFDTARVLRSMRRLCESGNTVVVVEHDPALLEHADHLIVLGPSGGEAGGWVLYEGPPAEFTRQHPGYFRVIPLEENASEVADGPVADGVSAERRPAHGALLTPARVTDVMRPARVSEETAATRVSERSRPARISEVDSPALILRNVRQHNLDIPLLSIPLDRLVVVTGVSGSGKSTLLDDVLYRNLLRGRGRPADEPGVVASLEGGSLIGEAFLLSQSPLGRSIRSNIVTYLSLYTAVRSLLARTPRARALGLEPGAFSFNVPGGRCEACQGLGTVTVEMHFLSDLEIACEACRGRRFREDVLEVTWRGRNIIQILDLTVSEALEFLEDLPETAARLSPLVEVGLDYLRLGQSTATLSGGEAQRLRVASLLAEGRSARRAAAAGRKRSGGASSGPGTNLFIFDEPTAGLHPRDIHRLLGSLRGLLALGHAVIAVEHQLDFIAAADHVIDLGPGAGAQGGRLVYAGGLEGLTRVADSATGRALAARGALP